MKPRYLLAPLATFCAIAALVGCTSANRQVSGSWFDQKKLELAEAPRASASSPPVILYQSAFRNLDTNADETVNLDEWQRFDTSVPASENFNALDDNGDGQINGIEFLSQAPKQSKSYHFFGDRDKINDSYFSGDNKVFQQPGLQLFSIHF